jgi:hypothetical protein
VDVPGTGLSRRAARFLVGVAVWNILTYTMFTKNLFFGGSDEPDRPTGYYVAHSVLIVVNVVIALVLAPIGWRALQAHRARAAVPSGIQDPSQRV